MLQEILQSARDQGANLAGWAALDRGELALYSLLPASETKLYQSALVVGKSHQPSILGDYSTLPSLEYDREYRKLNDELLHLVTSLEKSLREQNVPALAVHPSTTLDTVHHRGLISHRALAQRAGLGVRGRNNLLVTVAYRSHIRLATLLTALEVPSAPPVVFPYPCWECDECHRACPVGALGDHPGDFRLDRCLTHLERVHRTELSPQICGICMAVCPGMEPQPSRPAL